MKKQIWTPFSVIESDTEYTAEQDRYEIGLSDAARLSDEAYLSVSEFHPGYLDAAVYIKGKKDVTLDFGGATLYLRGRIQPFLLDGCENVTIRNVTVEYDRSFYTEMRIVKNENGRLSLNRLPKFPCRVENGYLIPYSDTWENRELHIGDMFVQVFDAETGEGKGLTVAAIGEEILLHDTPPCEVKHFRVSEEAGGIMLSGDIPPDWDSSMVAVFAHETRDKSSVMVCRSKDIAIENYRILNGAGMGIAGMYTRNLSIRRLVLARDSRSHGVVTNAADAVHLAACSGKIELTDCRIEGMIDDALNVHNNYYEICAVEGNRLTALRHPQCHALNAYFQAFGERDEIAVYRGRTLAEKCRAKIENVKVLDRNRIEIRVTGDVSAVQAGDLLENLSTQPELTIKNCSFGKANSHLRLQTRGKTRVENCRISLPLMFTGDQNYWFEASPARDAAIENCEFLKPYGSVRLVPDGFTPTEEAPYYHRGVKIRNCTFENPVALIARDSDGIEFTGNRLKEGGKPEIRLENCRTERTDGCAVLEIPKKA